MRGGQRRACTCRARRDAALRQPGLLRRERRVQQPDRRAEHDEARRGDHRRPEPHAVRRDAAGALPFTRWQFLTVNIDGGVPVHVLDREQERQGRAAGAPRASRAQYYDLQSNVDRAGVHPDLELQGQRVRREDQALGRAVFQRAARSRRSTTSIRSCSSTTSDLVVGNTTRARLRPRQPLLPKPPGGRSREIGTVTIGQTYYTDARAVALRPALPVEQRHGTEQVLRRSSLPARAVPTDRITANFRAEYDTNSAPSARWRPTARSQSGTWLQAIAGWSQRRYIEGLAGFNDKANASITTSTAPPTSASSQNRYGGSYHVQLRHPPEQHPPAARLAYYNAQCCGFTVEYQTFDLSRLSHDAGPAGSPVQFLDHAGRHRQRSQHLRCTRRARARRNR